MKRFRDGQVNCSGGGGFADRPIHGPQNLRAYSIPHKPLSLSFESCPELNLENGEPTQSSGPSPNDCPRAQQLRSPKTVPRHNRVHPISLWTPIVWPLPRGEASRLHRMVEIEGRTVARASEWLITDLPMGFISSAHNVGFFTRKAVRFQICAGHLLFVENGTEHGNGEVREIGCPFIELQPPHHAVVCKILRNARFRNSQMLREARLDGIGATAVAPAH